MAETKPRGQMTIKSTRLGPEWQTAVKKAAERSRMPLGDWIVQTCQDRATAILTNAEEQPETVPQHGVPARLDDLTDKLMDRFSAEIARRDAEQAERAESLVARLQHEQAEAARKMRRLARSGGRRR